MNTQRDLSAEAHRAKVDHLDQAIDHVAKRLTHVDDDAQFAARLIAALPERFSWFGWLTQSWAPRLAMMAIVASAALLWGGRQLATERPAVYLAAKSGPCLCAWPDPVEPVAPAVRTKPLEAVEPVELMEPGPDFERALPAVASPASVEIAALALQPMPAENAPSIESLVIADLPLTAESFSQRD